MSLPLGGKVSTKLTNEGITYPYNQFSKEFITFMFYKCLMKDRLTGFSQNLRRNMTKEEKRLWYDFLKTLPLTVNRQKVIGSYIADFYIAESRLIIELDGSQHYTEQGAQRDNERDYYFKRIGVKVLRYTNRQIHEEFDNVCNDIWRQIEAKKSYHSVIS